MDGLLQAARPLLAPAFSLWGSPVTWLEMLAFVLSLAMVVCNIRVNPLAWPLAIVASLLYFLLFWDSRLYGEAGLQIFFVVVAVLGLVAMAARHARPTARRCACATCPAARGSACWRRWRWPGRCSAPSCARPPTPTCPGGTRLPTAGSLAGQWLLGRKYVENWPVWVVVNVVSVGLFACKGLWLTVLLYVLFVLMALWGWRAWRRLARAPWLRRR